MSNYALRIPDSLFEYARKCADEENVSMNQFFVMAIAEKVSALKTADYFEAAGRRADPGRATKVLAKVPARMPDPGDEIGPALSVQQERPAYPPRKAQARPASRTPRRR
jgi:hypothetical protein